MSGSPSSSYREQTKNSKGIHVRLDGDLLTRLENLCKKRGISRAKAIEQAVVAHCDQQDRVDVILSRLTEKD